MQILAQEQGPCELRRSDVVKFFVVESLHSDPSHRLDTDVRIFMDLFNGLMSLFFQW